MTEPSANDLRSEVRQELILTQKRICELGDYLGLTPKEITTVQTYCFWLSCDLNVTAITLEDLVTVLDNRLLRLWVRRNHLNPTPYRFEALCDTFAIYASQVVDEIIAGVPF